MEKKKKQANPFGLRLPPDVKNWIASQAAANSSSQNSEIIRAIRERMNSEINNEA